MIKPKIASGLCLLVKGIIVSVAAIAGMMIGSYFASALGIKSPTLPGSFNPGAMLIYKLISGIFFYILLGYFFSALKQKKLVIFWLAFLFNFVVVNLLNIIEASYFTTMVLWPFNLIAGAGESLGVSTCLALLFSSKDPESSFKRTFKEWFYGFSIISVVRLMVSWLSFAIIYYAIGMIIAPIVLPYYQSATFGLQLPSAVTIIQVQLCRGALILLFSLPLIILWKKGRLSFFICFGLLLFYKDVVLGLLGNSWFPWILRIVHGTELTVDSFLLAGVYSLMLIAKKVRDKSLSYSKVNI